MARPFYRWKPSLNVDLFTKAADGPLVLDGDDERWPLLAQEWIRASLYADPLVLIDYLLETSVEGGTDPLRGLRVSGYQYMPANLIFPITDPANMEPRPDDASYAFGGVSYHYINLGHRMAMRGWIATFEDNLNVELEVHWGDSQQRDASDARGAWTGLVGTLTDGTDSDHLVYSVHGKRLGDVNWEHRGGHVDSPATTFTPATAAVSPWNGVDAGRARMIITGSNPAWTVTTQYWTGTAWVDITSSVVDLLSHAPSGSEDLFGIVGHLFHGATKRKPTTIPSPPPMQDTYFRRVSVSQFEPFVLDTNKMTVREYYSRLATVGIAHWPPESAPFEKKLPVVDVVHRPGGSDFAPEKVRDYDDDGGWGVLFQEKTILHMRPIEDTKMIRTTQSFPEATPLCLSDNYAFGPTIPFAYVGRYKLKDLSSWGTERCLVSWGPGGYATSPAAMAAGFGLTWRDTNDGEIVLKYWDGSAGSWLELVAPLRIEDYESKLVDLAFAWTGSYGSPVGRPNSELRILVDGITVASVVEPLAWIRGTWSASIGTLDTTQRLSFVGHWFGGAAFFEPCSDTDIAHAFDEEGSGGFENASFEDAALSGRPGEAANWEWNSFQRYGGWADFNAYRDDLVQYRYGREGFEGGWLWPYAWAYADGTARLAATGFTADDVGLAAWQMDIDKNFILTGYSPITWAESEVGENQGWASSLAATAYAAGIFNEGIASFETTMEIFSLWGSPPGITPLYTGPPWMDAYNLIPPCEDTLGPYGGATGFSGWFDSVYGTNLDPICTESFEEAWGNDPFSTGGTQQWKADTAPNGVMRGQPITFPLSVPPNDNRLIIITDATTPAMFSLPSLAIADMATLVADLNTLMAAHLPSLGLEFGSWTDGDEEGLTFGWDQTTIATIWWVFATLQSERTKDMRGHIGLCSFSPNGYYTGVGLPCWNFASLPAGVDTTDRFLADTWSANSVKISPDLILGDWIFENDLIPALFDSVLGSPTLMERFILTGWTSASAVWVSDLSAVALTQALFDSGTATEEMFLDTLWPDEIFPT